MIAFCRELAVNPLDLRAPRGGRFLRAREVANPDDLSVARDTSAPKFLRRSVVHAEKSALVVLAHANVSQILRLRRLAQIAPSVIGRVAVRVVNVFGGPIARHVKPSQSMSEHEFVLDSDRNVSERVWPAGNLPRPAGIPFLSQFRSRPPAKYAGFWVVIQNRSNEVRREVNHLRSLMMWPACYNVAHASATINMIGG